MRMTLREFLNKASTIKEELLDKEIVVRAENGVLMSPVIKFIKNDNANLSLDKENVYMLIITTE
jgi:hypothetical protein